MNIGNISEIIGSGAVVISVVYLAFQVRKQTEEARLAATRELAGQFAEVLAPLTQDKDFNELYLEAVRDYDSLPNPERLRMSAYLQRGFRLMEQQYLHTKRGNVDPAHFESLNLAYFEWMTLPGIQQWWKATGDLFEEGFRQHVDNLFAQAREKGYDSTFKKRREADG